MQPAYERAGCIKAGAVLVPVGAFDARNTFGTLLDRVEQGEELVITRRGRPVARLVPMAPITDRDAMRLAAARIAAGSVGVTLGGQVCDGGAVVPSLWRLEVADAVQTTIRRRRIDAAFRDATLADLCLLAIGVDPEADARAWRATLAAAERWQLTSCDAAHFKLAQRRQLPLATLDADLRRAAQGDGIALLGLSIIRAAGPESSAQPRHRKPVPASG